MQQFPLLHSSVTGVGRFFLFLQTRESTVLKGPEEKNERSQTEESIFLPLVRHLSLLWDCFPCEYRHECGFPRTAECGYGVEPWLLFPSEVNKCS